MLNTKGWQLKCDEDTRVIFWIFDEVGNIEHKGVCLVFSDLQKMIDNIKLFTAETKDKVLICDNPKMLRFGFVAENYDITWEIEAKNLKNSNVKKPIYKEAFKTHESKLELVKYLNNEM